MSETTQPKDFFSYRVGNIEVSIVNDGHITVPLAAGLIPGVPLSDVQASLRKADLPTETVTTTFAPLFFRNGPKTTLIDTGFGPDVAADAGSTRGLLVGNMKANGVDPADVDVVVISHFHPDHVNGLLSQGKLTFPNATIMVPEPEWQFWTDIEEMKRAPEGRMSQLFQKTAAFSSKSARDCRCSSGARRSCRVLKQLPRLVIRSAIPRSGYGPATNRSSFNLI